MKFRQWIMEMWYKYLEENEHWHSKPTCRDATEYFRNNRWFLKKKYQDEVKNNGN